MYSWGILILRFVTFISFTIHTYTHTHTCIYILVTPPFSLFYSLLFLSCARILLTFPTLPSGGRFSTPFVTHAKWGQHEFVSFFFFLRWNQLNCNHHKSPTNWLGVVAMWNVAQVNRRERKKEQQVRGRACLADDVMAGWKTIPKWTLPFNEKNKNGGRSKKKHIFRPWETRQTETAAFPRVFTDSFMKM